MKNFSVRADARLRLAALVAVSVVALSACSSESDATQAESVTVTDPWVKAIDEGMTAAFGVVSNDSSDDVTIVSASTAAAPMVELHQTSADATGAMSMSPVEGGFVIPASGSLTLEPGGFHIMLMGVTEPIVAGDDVTVTLTFADDSTLDVTAPAKEFTGANEDYDGGDHMDMDHGDGDHDSMDMDMGADTESGS